jgi:hypothetical protein
MIIVVYTQAIIKQWNVNESTTKKELYRANTFNREMNCRGDRV